MHRRTRRTIWILAAVLLLLAVAIYLRSKAPPEAARLLPESDGIIYINLKPIRSFLHKDLKPANVLVVPVVVPIDVPCTVQLAEPPTKVSLSLE